MFRDSHADERLRSWTLYRTGRAERFCHVMTVAHAMWITKPAANTGTITWINGLVSMKPHMAL